MSLSELFAKIEGEFSLERRASGWYARKGLYQEASIEAWAETAEEAVAKLLDKING